MNGLNSLLSWRKIQSINLKELRLEKVNNHHSIVDHVGYFQLLYDKIKSKKIPNKTKSNISIVYLKEFKMYLGEIREENENIIMFQWLHKNEKINQ